jgi:MarR family transcriptional regulator, 2-MHQ and catechol-resistance regulon repressor
VNLYIEIFMTTVTKTGSGSLASGVHLWLILWRAFRAMEGHADRSIAGLGLCQSDFGVMEALLHKGPLAVKTLGEKVLLASASMTAAIDRLERRGWVERENHPEDRRSRVVRLTVEGRKTIDELFADHERDMELAVEGLDDSERGQLVELLRKMGQNAQARLER